jgi:hypothetical protein
MRKKNERVLISAQYVDRDFWLKFVEADGDVQYKISKPERIRRLMAEKIERYKKLREGE